MNATKETVRKPTAQAIADGDIVAILGDNRFTGMHGLVIDIKSDLHPEDGPVAVFFDKEIGDHEFNIFGRGETWLDGIPTKENYRSCYRVICFPPEELQKEDDFPLESIVRRKFGTNPHHLYELDFPLQPGTHACQFKGCESGQLATKRTLVNVWGSILVVYSCEPCHQKWHGAWTDPIELKNPLPGLPSK